MRLLYVLLKRSLLQHFVPFQFFVTCLSFFLGGEKKKAVKDGPQALLAALPHPHRRASADSDKTAFAQGQ